MDAPQLTIEDAIAEAQCDLWTLRQMQPPTPDGDEAGYVCAAHFYISDISDALRAMQDAEHMALAEIPAHIKWEIDQSTRRFGPGEVEEVASLAPEVRRYVAVCRVRELVEWLQDDLQSEGKPQGRPDLRLVRRASGG